MVVIYTKQKNHLARRLGKGISRDDAVAQAEANIAAMLEEGVAEIDRRLADIQDVFAAFTCDKSATGALYDAANALGGLAPVFGFTALGAVAFNLCEFLSFFEDNKTICADVVKIHMDSLSILRSQAEMDESAADGIVQHLVKMVEHILSRQPIPLRA